MSLAVGLLLLGVFFAFAALMFLEKLSALLALPLMAFSFLLVATVADLFAPQKIIITETRVETDAYGRRRSVRVDAEVPARFAAWCNLRHAQLQALHARAVFLREGVEETAAVLRACGPDAECPVRLRSAIQVLYEREMNHAADVRARWTDTRRWPHELLDLQRSTGAFSVFEQELATLDASPHLRPIIAVLEEFEWPAGRREVERIIAHAQALAAEAEARHSAPPSVDDGAPRVAWGAGYLYQHLRLMLANGSLTLAGVIMASLFGGMFAVYVRNLKVAERMVYWTAEFAGEHPWTICLAIFLITGVIFTSVGGLGTVIMLGAIILPILRSVGLGAVLSSGLFLIGIAMGGTLHPVSRRLWMEFYSIPADQLDGILWTMVGLYFLCGLIWIAWGTRRKSLGNFCAEIVEDSAEPAERIPRRLMLAPLVPVGLVYFGRIEEITAFTVALVYMYLCVCRRPGATRVLARSLIEGAQLVIPPVLLMVGIGMLITAMRSAPVQGYLEPLLRYVVPQTRWGYILLFSMAAPLALYRGPLNIWGMGLAVSATLLATSSLSPAAILGAILAAGALQSVCDPTNTANVWIAGFQGVTVNQILRAMLPIVWLTAIAAVVIFGLRFVV